MIKGERHLVAKKALAWDFRGIKGIVRCPKAQASVSSCIITPTF